MSKGGGAQLFLLLTTKISSLCDKNISYNKERERERERECESSHIKNKSNNNEIIKSEFCGRERLDVVGVLARVT